MSQAIRFHRMAARKYCNWKKWHRQPGPGEVLLRHSAIGINFIDTYQRSGLYPVSLPSGLAVKQPARCWRSAKASVMWQ
jgi:NADPH2:quinone reductase